MNLARVPLESPEPIAALGRMRLVVVATALLSELIFDVPHMGRLLLVTGLIALPWALFAFAVARRAPRAALSPLAPLADLVILAVAELAVPQSYVAVRVLAMFAIAYALSARIINRGRGAGVLPR